mmetsp:Transcript_16475/g.39440  ORF Transcript_16475/g.39440 Transcript_16475/m.39440 type:complete len:122 (+) Transcript_16475:864-1229(+)
MIGDSQRSLIEPDPPTIQSFGGGQSVQFPPAIPRRLLLSSARLSSNQALPHAAILSRHERQLHPQFSDAVLGWPSCCFNFHGHYANPNPDENFHGHHANPNPDEHHYGCHANWLPADRVAQ